MRVLVVNAGSSSLKVDLVDDGVAVDSWDDLPDRPPDVDAVGHRIVHGGPDLVEPVVIDAAVERRVHDLVELAPLHQPKSLHGLAAARELLPGVPHVACFDTAFHATLPAAASTYALPRAWRNRWAVRRYGFHGLSHAWAAGRAAELAPGGRRVVTCHLGAGASLAAVLEGRSVDTTMGFTPLEGLVMATRSGSVDPGLLLWLEEHEGLRPGEVADALEHDSGLQGLAGTADMREVLARAAGPADDPGTADARLALDVYLHSLAGHVAAMTVALGGLDTLVFTGGVGEHAPAVRAGAAARLAHLGVAVDPARNASATGNPDTDVSAAGPGVRVLVVRAREDLQIAAGVVRALSRPPARPAGRR
ncbi:acetate/propionate family kinase [Modestobacter sp. NPDC049651]|uniref:acetate/propionate family kinase n=1 Tax=unclassified Modestobacter TaxID=2643866 RepID=UPI0033E33290